MRKISRGLCCLILLLFLCLVVPAQTPAPPTKTLQDAVTATGNGENLPVSYYNGAVVQVVITGTATITWRGTVDGTNYIDVLATNLSTGAQATTATASGLYSLFLPGFAYFRAPVTAYLSGTVTVTARQTQAFISKGVSAGSLPSGIDAAKIADGSVSNAEFQRLDGVGGTILFSGGALGTPSSGTATNLTGLPISTGVSGLGTGVATFLGTPSKTNLNSMLTGDTIAYVGTANSWGDGIKQTFNPNGTNAGINVGAHTADPSSLANGDLWYDSTGNLLRARINGASVILGAGITNGAGANVISKSNGTNLVASRIDDAGAGNPINIDSGTNSTVIGDVQGLGNATLLTIDDAGGAVTITGGTLFNPSNSNGSSTLGGGQNPWGSVFIGNAATNNIQITGTATSTRVATFPDGSGTVALIGVSAGMVFALPVNNTVLATATGTVYTSPGNAGTPLSTTGETTVSFPCPRAGKLSNLYVRTGTTAKVNTPATIITIRVNGSDTAVTVTMTQTTTTTTSDTTHGVSINAGDLITVSLSTTGAAAVSTSIAGISFRLD